MKHVLMIICMVLLFSCTCNEYRNLVRSNYVVLDKQIHSGYYQVYMFSDSQSFWYDTDQKTYESVKPGDTLKTLTVEITKYR